MIAAADWVGRGLGVAAIIVNALVFALVFFQVRKGL